MIIRKFLLIIITLSLLVSGCESDAEKTSIQENEELKEYISELESEINDLELEIKALEKNDQYYFDLGVDRYNQAEELQTASSYLKAIEAFDQLIQEYPESTYLSEASNYLNNSGKMINQIRKVDEGKIIIEKALANNNFSAADEKLNEMKDILPSDEYSQIRNTIEEKRNNPLKVSIRDIQAEPQKYSGERIELGPLKVMENRINRASFKTHLSTGIGFTEFDGDVSIEVFYDETEDLQKWRNLSSADRPIINVVGIFKVYSNDRDRGYIEAEMINQ